MMPKICRNNFLNWLLLTFFAVLMSDGLFHGAIAGPVGVWQAIHEPAEDGSVTSTAYIDNDSGDRFSLTINAIQKKKVCAVKRGSLPYIYVKDYEGKLLVDKNTIWEGKIVSINPALGDILILQLGFDWSDLLKELKKGHNLVLEHKSDTTVTEVEFPLKGSAKAINAVLDKQWELAQEHSKESEVKP